MKSFCVIPNVIKDKDLLTTNKVCDYLREKGCNVSLLAPLESEEQSLEQDVSHEFECCIVLGGDGTVIRAARVLCGVHVPIVGINIGTLGFLSVIETNELFEALDMLINDRYHLEKRMMVSVNIEFNDGSIKKYVAMNDAAVSRNNVSPPITVGVKVNGVKMSTYIGDGVIVATPTGSTGYNLSAGGPIATPEAELMLVTPICPHTLNSRSFIVSGNDIIELDFPEGKTTEFASARLNIDGQVSQDLSSAKKITIIKSEYSTLLVRFENRSFFDIVYKKLVFTQ